MTNHPNRSSVEYIINGFTNGFDIGYSGLIEPSCPHNLLSACNNPRAVHEAITKELSRHTSGPFDVPPFHNIHCSPLGAVPKKNNTYRLILDLSSPKNNSVNEGINHDEFSVKYSSFDYAVNLVRSLGPHCTMAKMDIRHAFRLCPVRQADWPLLGMFWNNQYFVDTRLPFGSRSSPFIFNTFADLLLWILITCYGIPFILHYLDDFFLADKNNKLSLHMETMKSAFKWLGVPLAPEKIEGPVTRITYLGIELDSRKFTIQLPQDKLTNLLKLWSRRRSCTKLELLSLIGKLSFAAKVVKPGRMFLRRLINLSTSVKSLHHHIYINKQSKADIDWWDCFLPLWNGISLIQEDYLDANHLSFFTDASNKGFGAVYGNKWFAQAWPAHFDKYHINVK